MIKTSSASEEVIHLWHFFAAVEWFIQSMNYESLRWLSSLSFSNAPWEMGQMSLPHFLHLSILFPPWISSAFANSEVFQPFNLMYVGKISHRLLTTKRFLTTFPINISLIQLQLIQYLMSSKNHHIPKYLGERKLNWEQWLVHDKFLAMFLSRWMNCSCQWRNYSVLLPDLRKEFEVPPYSQSVELGSQIELRCHPPQGKPKPRVSNCWANVQVHVGSTVSNQDIQLSVHFRPNYIWSPCRSIFLWFTITLCSTDGT